MGEFIISLRMRGNTGVKEIQRDKKKFVLKEREDHLCFVSVVSRPRLLSVSSQGWCWCHRTLPEPGIGEGGSQTPRDERAEEDPLPPPPLQHQAQLRAVGPLPDLNMMDLKYFQPQNIFQYWKYFPPPQSAELTAGRYRCPRWSRSSEGLAGWGGW